MDEPVNVPTLNIDWFGSMANLIFTMDPGLRAILGLSLALWCLELFMGWLRGDGFDPGKYATADPRDREWFYEQELENLQSERSRAFDDDPGGP